jgi:cytochrome c biogenesis protein CcdA
MAFAVVPLVEEAETYKRRLGATLLISIGMLPWTVAVGLVVSLLGQALLAQLGGPQNRTALISFGLAVVGILALLRAAGLLNFLPRLWSKPPSTSNQGSIYRRSISLGSWLGGLMAILSPTPTYFVLLTFIALSGQVLVGIWLMVLYTAGLVLPLALLSMLAGRRGVRASLAQIGASQERFRRLSAGVLVASAIFLLALNIPLAAGLFTA